MVMGQKTLQPSMAMAEWECGLHLGYRDFKDPYSQYQDFNINDLDNVSY